MSYNKCQFRTYRFEPYRPPKIELPFNQDPSNIVQQNNEFVEQINDNSSTITLSSIYSDSSIPLWRPTSQLRAINTRFKNTILYQHICIPCVYCGRLLYPSKAKWILYNENFIYPIQIHFSQTELIFTGHSPSLKISVCNACNKKTKPHLCPHLHPIPREIEAVPLIKRRFLSPVFLHCSLGRNTDNHPFSEYRTLEGNMEFSKNMRAHKLYSGIIGAFLNKSSKSDDISWLTPQLLIAADWLKEHNCYIKPYSRLLSNSSLISSSNTGPFPTAEHSDNDLQISHFQNQDIIVSNSDFSSEIHDEDFHYKRLMAGFVHGADNTNLPLSFNDPELEPLLFPDLFPDGKGHYYELSTNNESTSTETYGKYIKNRLLCIDSRFRLHPYWPFWSYLQLEKLRNHQNTVRILRQQQYDKVYKLPTAAEIITKSIYTGQKIIDETKTMTLPTFIRTGETYFHEKLLHINTMITEYGLPSLFITLTMAEGKWTHLNEILKYTDNGNTLPTNRPLHATLHFTHRKQELKKHVWKKPAISEWGNFVHFFERVEFQNRGAAHTHSCIWVSKSIEDMIINHTIRADLPDPDLEPELYECVINHQIHTCKYERCGGPAPPGHMCKRNFPRPFASHTYLKSDELRYIYRCTKESDQWIIPYHAPTLLIWNAHMNIQYVTSRGLGRYLTKYVVKAEPSHVFNIQDGDHYRQHIIARHLGSMECMFLLLGETICDSSITVKYLPTDPENIRTHAVRPISTIDENDDDPYWKNLIEKYFARPHNDIFDNLTYPQYFKNYRLSTKSNLKKSDQQPQYQDDLNYFIIKRITPIIVRFRYHRIQDGEVFFYQQLLLTIPCRTEYELLGGYTTYREHFLNQQPEFQSTLSVDTSTIYEQQCNQLQLQFNQIMTILLDDLGEVVSLPIAKILTIQLDILKLFPSILSPTAIYNLPEDQYIIFNKITGNLGALKTGKYPFFFITGSAGTGKSYMIDLIIDWLKKTKKPNYLLMAPTGVAAQKIGGMTIHSALRLTQSHSGFKSLAFYDEDFKKTLLKVQTIIIDEISMVSNTLFTFLADMFARIHGNDLAFGGINVIVIGDLAQLPPVRALSVFYSPIWHLFYPLFLRQSRRQQEDVEFYNILEEIRFGNISSQTWTKLMKKASEYPSSQSLDILLSTTHIVGYRESADQINQIICNALPVEDEKFFVSKALDFQNGTQILSQQSQEEFKSKTNLPLSVRLQQGARVMYLNNSLINEGICNGTIGVITDLNKNTLNVQIAFCIHGAIVHKWITQQTNYFYAAGQHASRTQFPLQNSFALTVHKTQSLTLPKISIDLAQLFSPGQAYVAISRCPKWKQVQISSLDKNAFITDPEIVKEYRRLEKVTMQPLPSF